MHDGWRCGPSKAISNQCFSKLRMVGQFFLGAGVHAEGSSAEPYTPMPPFFSHASMPQLFSHASSSHFQAPFTPMPPPTEGFFAGVFQPYSSMMAAPSHSPGHFYPPPLSMYPP
ncbi:hypothetical protein V6N13_122662 [Hibiscus sabdariffa]